MVQAHRILYEIMPLNKKLQNFKYRAQSKKSPVFAGEFYTCISIPIPFFEAVSNRLLGYAAEG
jgi:hypothetical protein